MLEGGLNRDSPPVAVHLGGCHMAGKRWKGAPRPAGTGRRHEACGPCRPDAELGHLDG
ncbi:DUF6233 domain-containing protein [Streptomyces sp. NPDC020792]|uniref:DUF6233 domain-containing protein n=1 Tax=Streptomyces sp. NPDC020792 TaxID=3365089 RepID=UPI0037A79F66